MAAHSTTDKGLHVLSVSTMEYP